MEQCGAMLSNETTILDSVYTFSQSEDILHPTFKALLSRLRSILFYLSRLPSLVKLFQILPSKLSQILFDVESEITKHPD